MSLYDDGGRQIGDQNAAMRRVILAGYLAGRLGLEETAQALIGSTLIAGLAGWLKPSPASADEKTDPKIDHDPEA